MRTSSDLLSNKMASNQDVAARKQQGTPFRLTFSRELFDFLLDLQAQYSNYKTALQSLAQKVGEIEQEIEEHKFVAP
jgi:hypothetical protein